MWITLFHWCWQRPYHIGKGGSDTINGGLDEDTVRFSVASTDVTMYQNGSELYILGQDFAAQLIVVE